MLSLLTGTTVLPDRPDWPGRLDGLDWPDSSDSSAAPDWPAFPCWFLYVYIIAAAVAIPAATTITAMNQGFHFVQSLFVLPAPVFFCSNPVGHDGSFVQTFAFA